MQTIPAFLLVLGVLVFVHELGHFLAARRVGIRVLTFSLGFGPKLLKVKRGDTEYCISALPLGGYVKMAGETPDDPRTGAPDEFLSKTKWQRFQVLIMGPVMNLMLAVVFFAIVFTQGAERPDYLNEPAVVGAVDAGSPAERAGIAVGDRFISVGGKTVHEWEDFEIEISTWAKQSTSVSFVRAGETRTVQITPDAVGSYDLGVVGVVPDISPAIRGLLPGDPAQKAGLAVKDLIYAVNGTRVVTPQDLSAAISKYPEQEIDLTVIRGGERMDVRLKTTVRDGRGMIGITPGLAMEIVQYGPVEAVRESVKKCWESSDLILRTLGGLFTGQTSVRQLQGPVGIAQLSGEAAQVSWLFLLEFMAMLSLNLGLLNLMPVPVLDGGHILIMALEGIARRDFSMQVKEKMLIGGFVVLMMLMVTVIYNDLTRVPFIEGLMPWR